MERKTKVVALILQALNELRDKGLIIGSFPTMTPEGIDLIARLEAEGFSMTQEERASCLRYFMGEDFEVVPC